MAEEGGIVLRKQIWRKTMDEARGIAFWDSGDKKAMAQGESRGEQGRNP